ncbi:MAG: hypothetical protein ORN23_07160 [Chthoniobacterales bacterium]|nr:hypothetical protein [Chthoniobacterales bacterium]
MSLVYVDASKLKSQAITRKIDRAIEEGESIILEFRSGKEVSPERILRILKASAFQKRLNLVIRDASLKEFVKNGITGALLGGAAGLLAKVLPRLLGLVVATGPVSLPAVLVATGIGAAIGALVSVCLTPVADLTIYRTNGVQRVKIESMC